MKILQVVSIGYPAGGAQLSVRLIRDELRKRGHDVRVLSSDLSGEGMFSDYQFKAVSPASPLKALQHLFYLKSYQAMHDAIDDFVPDIIHFHNIDALSPSVFFATRHIPAVMTVHAPEQFTLKLLPWFLQPSDFKTRPFELSDLTVTGKLRYCYYRFLQRPIYQIGFRNVANVISPSKYLAEAIQCDFPVAKIKQIYNGIDLPAYSPLPTNKRILYVGRLAQVKGVDYLIRAFASVVRDFPDAELHIVGDGSDRKELEQLVLQLGLNKHIVFRGWIKAGQPIIDEYKSAIALVIPSVWPENLPTVCIEALAVGRPVIGTKTGGIPELVEDDATGYIVPIKDVDLLGKALLKLIGDEKKLQSMSRAAAESARRFNMATFIDRIENLYKESIHGDTHR